MRGVADRLRDMIIEGDLAVGERLHAANLAAALAVSRTPIREAVKLLAAEGFVDLLPGRGARVAALSAKTIGELLETIAGIERHAAELAAERMSAREFDRLRRLHDKMAADYRAGDLRAYFKRNNAIHAAIVAAAKTRCWRRRTPPCCCGRAAAVWRHSPHGPAGPRRWPSTSC